VQIFPLLICIVIKGVRLFLSKSLRTDDFINRVVERYSDMLVRISFTYLKNLSGAEDVAQEVFLKLLEKRPAFENDEHEKAWLIRVAINQCKNQLKTAWFRKTTPFDDSIDLTTPEEIEVIGAVLELPPKYRCIIQFFYYEEYSIAEIAAVLGQKVSTTGSQLHRARKLLKAKLEEEFDHD
jgi:RNA polymerase sigma-70 factor, ECF subfamily